MAVAGKVAITPRGAWDGTVLYDKLSLVTHENAIYIAKKQSQGVVPVDGEYWMFCMQNAGAEDIQNIVNGTTVVGKANSLANSPKINGVEFDGTKDIEVSDRRYCMVGSNVADSAGWYKVAEQTMSDYGNSNVTFKVTSTYGNYYLGILELQMRSNYSSIQCTTLKWHTRIGFSTEDVICVVNGMTYTIYIHNKTTQYNRVMFEIISESSIARAQSGITLFNSGTPEETEPVPTYISEDGATVLRAIQDSSGNNIVDTYFPKNKVVNNKVTTKSGYAVDARQLNETVEGSYAKGVAEDISKINADLLNIGSTITTTLVEVGGSDDIVVYATICMQILSATMCNLYISYKISANNIGDSSVYNFMSAKKIRNALGVSTLTSINTGNSQVVFKPCLEYVDGELTIPVANPPAGLMGYTGVVAGLNATHLYLGRIYNDSGAFGAWDITRQVFAKGTYGQINFYGATYS